METDSPERILRGYAANIEWRESVAAPIARRILDKYGSLDTKERRIAFVHAYPHEINEGRSLYRDYWREIRVQAGERPRDYATDYASTRGTWRELIQNEMDVYGEAFDEVVSCTLSNAQLSEDFDLYSAYGCAPPFTLWTTDRVYFPVRYDGAEWAQSVPRYPNGEATKHIGAS